MQLVTHIPGAPLSQLVAYLWWMCDVPAHTAERIVPSGTLELVVNLNADEIRISPAGATAPRRYSGAVVSGAYQRFFDTDTTAHASIVGVHFKPGGAGAVLGLPPGELADQHVDLETLWGRAAIELRERLCAVGTPAERLVTLEAILQSRPLARRASHGAVPLALAQLARPGATVRDVAASVHLSWRRLIEVFTAEVGMTPKRLQRVLRFQQACQLARQWQRPDWARVAQRCGYFDQSHLIHDVRELAGLSPVQLVEASKRVKDHHVAIPEGSNLSKPGRGAAATLRSCRTNRSGAGSR
jgi:AraC-like DNA-binding protein